MQENSPNSEKINAEQTLEQLSQKSFSSSLSGSKVSAWITYVSFFGILLVIMTLTLLILLTHKLREGEKAVQLIQHQTKIFSQTQQNFQENTRHQISNLSQQMTEQQNAVLQIKLQLQALKNHTPSADIRAFKIAEIAYYIRTAQVQLNIHQDIPQALILLKQAEYQVNNLNTANNTENLNDFQAQLLKNISLLQSLPMIDKDAIILKLDTLHSLVPNLSILVAPKADMAILQNTPHQAHKKWFQRAWDNIKAALRELIIVRHQDDKIPALMSPQEQIYLQENLQLLLKQAQWALISQHAEVYQKTLQEIHSCLQKYYVQNSANTREFLKLLQPLLHQNIAPALPDLTKMLTSLREEG